MAAVVTFDLGTSYFKAAVFDDQLSMVALARVATPVESPGADRRQIAPDRFLAALTQLCEQLRQRLGRAALPKVISFATQTNSFVLLDGDDRPVTPIILWNDRRAVDQVDRLRALAAGPDLYDQTGVPDFAEGFMAAKLLWLETHEPELLRRAARVCLISDYLTLLLTGEHVTEGGAAGLSGLVDIHRLRWRTDVLDAMGMSQLGWPRIARAGTPAGQTHGRTAQRLGLDQAQFVVGCLDQYAGALGAGNVEPGGISETTGTVLATVRLADGFDPTLRDRGVFQGPSFAEGLYYQMLFGDVSAHLLEVFRREQAASMSFAQLDELAAAAPPGCGGLCLDAEASAAQHRPIFTGRADAAPLGYRVRAILEGVATSLREQVRQLTPAAPPRTIASMGGAARSALWLAIKADALGVPVRPVGCEEPTCRGAAVLGLAAAMNASPARVIRQRLRQDA